MLFITADSNCLLGFGTGFTKYSEKTVIDNNGRGFSKQLAQPVLLKTDLNQLIGIVATFLRSFRHYILSSFCTKQRLW